MDNFKAIYQILKYLECAMDYSDPDYDPISATALSLSQERWSAIIRMLVQDGYIEGVLIKDQIRASNTIIRFAPGITLKGLEYLHENSMMKKAMNLARGIKDIIPGL